MHLDHEKYSVLFPEVRTGIGAIIVIPTTYTKWQLIAKVKQMARMIVSKSALFEKSYYS